VLESLLLEVEPLLVPLWVVPELEPVLFEFVLELLPEFICVLSYVPPLLLLSR
jgi:hypothetical protein